MPEISHSAAITFARKISKQSTRADAQNLARAYLQLREMLDETVVVDEHERRLIQRDRLRRVLERIDGLIADVSADAKAFSQAVRESEAARD